MSPMLQRFSTRPFSPASPDWSSSPKQWWMGSSPDSIARLISGSARSSPSIGPTPEGDDLRHVDWNVFARTERCI